MEHHANIVPWQLVAEEVGAVIRVIPIDERGVLVLDDLDTLLGSRTKMLSVVHVSNALGTVNPVAELTAAARAKGIPVLIDGAQAVGHGPVDVQSLDCDFYVLSGHKLYGPTGIGVLWGRGSVLEQMPPWQGGGDMIREVTFAKTTFAAPPARFEAGTPHIAGAIGLAAAVEWLRRLDWASIRRHEDTLLAHATSRVGELPGVRLIGTAPDKAGVLSFVLTGIHPHDIGTILDGEGIAVRAGHHCAQPVMDFFGVPATARASFALYNTIEDVDRLVAGIRRVQEIFR
jgi:cysteine desulfurase/selenocysteine lyase